MCLYKDSLPNIKKCIICLRHNFLKPFLFPLGDHRTMVYYTAVPLMMQQQPSDSNAAMIHIKHEDESTPRLPSNSATLSGSVRCAYPMSPSNNSSSTATSDQRRTPSTYSNDDSLLEPMHSTTHPNELSPMQQPAARPANSGRGRPRPQSGAKSQPKPQFKCDQCNMMFGSKSAHTSHIKSHVKITLKSQQQQQQQQPIEQSPPQEHMFPPDGISDTSQPGTSPSADPYQCDVCHKTFAVPARLVRHYRTHTGERPFECEFCHKMFSVKENLQVHRRIHTKERPYKCDVCGRAFEHSGKLHRHMRIHTGERPHKCSVCGKTFIQSGQLVIHMRTHTGEKPYKCPVEGCGKGFTCSKQLKVHSRTHTGEKPYHCDICFRDFGYNHVLKLHRVQHYGSKCYKCTICDETFKNKKEMEAHIKGHANELPDEDGTDGASVSSYTTIIEEPVLPIRRVSETDTSSTSSSSVGVAAAKLPETPRETSSSDAMSDAEDLAYYQMYPRFNSTNYGSGHGMGSGGGVNPALLAAVSMAATAAAEQDAADAAAAAAEVAERNGRMRSPDRSRMHSPSSTRNSEQASCGSQYRMPNSSARSSIKTEVYSSYEPLSLMRQQGYFAPVPNVEEFKLVFRSNFENILNK